ncbi:MAG: YncE family protein [Chitinophagaceae bacterium]|nr:YncE family protein [Chitinophagaceae bacterium]
MIKKAISFLLFVGFLYTASAQNKTGYNVVKTFHIASSGGWDYIVTNNNKLYVSHGTQVNILDEKTGDSIGVILNTTGVHGIAFDNELGKGYTSNGRLNNVTVFDLKTNQVLTQISTGENPDAIYYEPYSKKIITNNGRSKNLSVIDPVTNTVISTIDVGGKPEEGTSDGEGKLYVNLEDKNQIIVINCKTFTVENRWSLSPGEAPTGLALDKKTRRLFSSCSDSKQLIVMDAADGKIIEKLPIGDGCDGVAFDEKNKLIFTSNGEGNITVIKELSANEFKVLETVTTKAGARTITIDEKTQTLFLPAADFEPADPQNPKARRKIVPGSFQVLVVKKD